MSNKKNSSTANAALVCGILGFFIFVCSILAIILGAMKKNESNGKKLDLFLE